MARRWQAIKVELLGGRGEACELPPGRIMVCPPGTTFDQLGLAVDVALARWDLSHLRMFTLADGTSVVDGEMREDLTGQAAPGTMLPDRPLASWGWGTIPDQYGRRWADDDGQSAPPPAVGAPEPDIPVTLPAGLAAPIDMQAVRMARRPGGARDLLDALTGVDLAPALQQVGSALMATWHATVKDGERQLLAPTMTSVAELLGDRDREGDDVLAQDLLATVRGEELAGTALPVDLDVLTNTYGDDYRRGAYVHGETGESVPPFMGDEAMVGEDAVVDLEDPAWVWVDLDGGTWSDMAGFVDTLPDGPDQARLEDAIQGKGAFSRFRRAVHDLDLGRAWHVWSDDHQWGRARATLADAGIRTTC